MDQTPERPLDEYLVLLSQAGSTDAMDGLARRWTPRLLRYALRVLGGSAMRQNGIAGFTATRSNRCCRLV